MEQVHGHILIAQGKLGCVEVERYQGEVLPAEDDGYETDDLSQVLGKRIGVRMQVPRVAQGLAPI